MAESVIAQDIFLLTLGKRYLEVFSMSCAAFFNLYIVWVLVSQFRPWDSIWISISVCKLNYNVLH